MSISSSIRKAGPYNGDGIATVFPFAFKVFQTSEVLVVQVDAQGVETTLSLTKNYTISLNVDQDASPGGAVSMLTAPSVGFTLTLSSVVDAIQSLTLTNQGGFYPKVINDALDRITIVAQQILGKLGGVLKVGINDGSIGNLPSKGVRSDMGLGFDANGDPVPVPLSSLVDAISRAEKGAALGVAGLDANLEVIKPQTGAAAQVALGRAGARKRADGTWDGVAIHLPNGYDLHLWADDLVSGQTYYVFSPVNAPSGGEWHVEVLRYSNDNISNQYRTIRLTAMVSTAFPNGTVFTSSDVFGIWSAWDKFNVGGGSGWQPVTLLNGNSKSPADHFGIRKTPDGTVTVSGIIRTVVNGALFNIPAGYIPNVMTPGAVDMFTPAQDAAGGSTYSMVSLNSSGFGIYGSSSSWIMINHSWQVI